MYLTARVLLLEVSVTDALWGCRVRMRLGGHDS
jgi:hypothetical protein